VTPQQDTGKYIHIGTGFDRGYLGPFCALVSSLIENHPEDRFEIHAIAEGLSDEEKKDIADNVERSGNRISFYSVAPSLVKKFVLSGEWTSAVYYRLFFSVLLAEHIQRLLYLDCDTLVVKSLRSFFDIDLGSYPLGAVYDNYVKTQPHIGIVDEGEYFNSGVLLINLDEWRKQEISEKAFRYLATHPEKIMFVDQCALNAVLRNNWKKLSSNFNLMYSVLPEGVSQKALNKILKDTVIIHFTLQRPWLMLCKNRLRHLYFRYLNRCGIASVPRGHYTDFTVRKIPAWLNIRLREFYFDSPFIQKAWRLLQTK
jgi:lipopolysaccharide biosynthesis glycosyltransferase